MNLKGDYIMVRNFDLTAEQLDELKFSEEEMEEIRRARDMPIIYDEDCPMVTPERAARFHRVNTSGAVHRA